MNLFLTRFKVPRNDPWRMFPAGAIAAAGLLILKLPAQAHGAALLYLAQVAAFLMLFLASSACTRLAQTAQVLAQRRIPDTAWRHSSKTCLATVSGNAMALCAALALPWVFGAAAPYSSLAGMALLSLFACAGALFSTLRSGLLKRLSNRTVYLGLAGLLALLAFGHGWFAALAALPAFVLLALAASWPLLAYGLSRHWRTAPSLPAPAHDKKAPAARTPAWIAGLSRNTVLQPRFRDGAMWKDSLMNGLRTGVVVMYFNMTDAALGDTVTVDHLLSLAGLLPMAMSQVMLRDLHWRSLLLPRRFSTRPLAYTIYADTIKPAALTLLCLCLCHVLVKVLVEGAGMAIVLHILEWWAILGMEAPLLLAIAVLLAALPRPHWTAWCVIIGAYALFIMYLIAKPHNAGIEGVHFGAAYAAGMLALTGVVMLAASRLWTPHKLLPYLPERPGPRARAADININAAR